MGVGRRAKGEPDYFSTLPCNPPAPGRRARAESAKTHIIAPLSQGKLPDKKETRDCPLSGTPALVATESNGGIVNALLGFSRAVDRLNEAIGKATIWLILIVVVISAGNAVMRFSIDWSSNSLLEIQWYLFSAIFLLCAGYVFNRNEHIRIDVIAGRLSARAQNWIDVFGIIVFMLPMVIMTMVLSWPVFMNAWNTGEMSANPGGLIRWPVRLLMPIGFFLLLLQGLSELVKRLAFLTGNGPNPLDKVKAKSAEEELAEEIRKHHVAAEVVDTVEATKDMLRNGGKEGGPK
jgi:TRAP-type mannitol/chloroaromatic compound transport system permease small subunit